MKLRAFAIITAFAMPGLASADKTPTNNNPPGNNPPSNDPTSRGMGDQNTPTSPDPRNGPATNDPSRTGATKNDTTTGDTSKTGKLSDADIKTIAHLHQVNQMEITLGKQAQKTGTAHIKDYAGTLVTDHQSADKDLTAFAKAHKLATIPADKPMTDADRQDDKDMTASMAHLKVLKGADFDKEYLNMMVSGHDKELTKIDTSISSVTDPDLKSLLETVKPALQRHADQARDLQKSPQAAIDPNKPIDRLPSSH